METGARRTTLALPADLLAEVDRAVRAGEARSRNAFVAEAIRARLAAAEAAAIDAAFTEMGNDPAYQTDAATLADEFGGADWEAFRLAEATPAQ